MTKPIKKLVMIGLSSAVILVLLVGFLIANRKPTYSEASAPEYPIFNDDGTITLPLNAISYGIRDPETNEIIDIEDAIIPVDEKINVLMSIGQNMPESKEYTLIILVNNEQREYKLNNVKLATYQFSLEKTEEVSLEIEVETRKEIDKEILFVLFENPNYTNSDEDIWAVTGFSYSYSCRLFLYADTNEQTTTISYTEEAETVDFDNRVRDIYLTDDREALSILAVTESGQEIDAIISNQNDYEMVYALGSLLDWEQYSFPDGDMIKYIKMPPKSTKIFKLAAPVVNRNTPYQVYVVPFGYMTRDDIALREENIKLVASLRTVIVPKGHIQSKKKGD